MVYEIVVDVENIVVDVGNIVVDVVVSVEFDC